MNPTFIIIFLILICAGISCKQITKQSDDNSQNELVAKQIRISELGNELNLLQNKKTEYGFFGITSNGTDCVYIIPADTKFNLEFEVMTEEQKPCVEAIRAFAKNKNLRILDTTYNNIPKYTSAMPAPVLRIYAEADKNQIEELVKQIMSEVFKNDDSTIYDVVP